VADPALIFVNSGFAVYVSGNWRFRAKSLELENPAGDDRIKEYKDKL